MTKIIVLIAAILGCCWLINRFPVLTAPAFNVGGLGIAWGLLLVSAVAALTLKLKSGK